MAEDKRLEKIDDNVNRLAQSFAGIETHIKNLVGPPSLEQRLIEYIDKRDEHKERGTSDAIQNLQRIMELEQRNTRLEMENNLLQTKADATSAKNQSEVTEKLRKENHAANEKRFARLEKWAYMALGMIMLAQAYIVYVVKK